LTGGAELVEKIGLISPISIENATASNIRRDLVLLEEVEVDVLLGPVGMLFRERVEIRARLQFLSHLAEDFVRAIPILARAPGSSGCGPRTSSGVLNWSMCSP